MQAAHLSSCTSSDSGASGDESTPPWATPQSTARSAPRPAAAAVAAPPPKTAPGPRSAPAPPDSPSAYSGYSEFSEYSGYSDRSVDPSPQKPAAAAAKAAPWMEPSPQKPAPPRPPRPPPALLDAKYSPSASPSDVPIAVPSAVPIVVGSSPGSAPAAAFALASAGRGARLASAVVSAEGARRTGDHGLVPALKVASIFSPSVSAAAGSSSDAVMGTPGSEPHAAHAPKTAPTTLAHSPPGSLQRHPRQYLSTTLTGEIADKVLEAARPLLEAEGIVDARTMTSPVLLPRGSGTGLVLGSAQVVSEVRCSRLIAHDWA